MNKNDKPRVLKLKLYSVVKWILKFIIEKSCLFFSCFNVKKFTPSKRIHFFVNLGIGIFIAIICHCFQHTTWGESIINSILDIYIQHDAGKSISNPLLLEDNNIVFVEIDDETYVKWNEPDITPRDKLAQIIKKCYDEGAKVILVDILFEKEDRSPDNIRDKKLKEVLKYIFDREEAEQEIRESILDHSFAGIIFLHRIGFKGDLKANIFYNFIKGEKWEKETKIFHHAIPLFSSNSNDNVVRYWNSCELYCNEEKRDDLIWGGPLLAVMLYEDKVVKLEHLKQAILSDINKTPTGNIGKFTFKNGNEYILVFNTSHTFYQRIRFKIIPGKVITGNNSIGMDFEREGNAYFFSAKYNNHFNNIGAKFFQDKIVIIGNSSPDTGDMHRTPVGDMPGMYLLGNAVYTILNTKQVKQLPWWIGYIIELFIIITAAYLFLYLQSFLALLVSSILILFGFVELGHWFFMKSGIFLNSGLIFAGMVFHKIAADIEGLFKKKLILTDSKQNL